MKNKELFLVKKIREMADKAGLGDYRRVTVGIGDDAAVVPSPDGSQEFLVATDLLVENTHFDRSHPPRALGHKTLARGLSDIAAMGGRPLYALLSLCLAPWAGRRWQKQFFEGLFGLAEASGVALIGGDLSAGDRVAADIVVIGSARRGRALLRSGAKTGDIVYVSGHLGGSALGLERIRSGRFRVSDAAVRRHWMPTPRLALGRFLAEKLGASSAMDVSDGLSIDLFRLAEESRVGAEIHATDVPVFPGATLDQALHGGEDYELLFTLPPLRKAPASFEGIPLTPIGAITSNRRLVMMDDRGRRRRLPVQGYQHQI